METTLNNGKTYRFEEGIFGTIFTYCFYGNQWNHISKSFKTWEEVESWIETMNRPVEESHNSSWNIVIPENYYGVPNRYYGD